MVLFVGNSTTFVESIGVGMFKDVTLMGTFPWLPTKLLESANTINMVTFVLYDFDGSTDPWMGFSLGVASMFSKVTFIEPMSSYSHDV